MAILLSRKNLVEKGTILCTSLDKDGTLSRVSMVIQTCIRAHKCTRAGIAHLHRNSAISRRSAHSESLFSSALLSKIRYIPHSLTHSLTHSPPPSFLPHPLPRPPFHQVDLLRCAKVMMPKHQTLNPLFRQVDLLRCASFDDARGIRSLVKKKGMT